MKTVFSNHSEVCHVWASRAQETGRSGNISFNGDVILSYHWWPMAKFINDNTVLVVDRPYSSSTSKHINYVCRAIPGYYKKLYVNCPAERYGYETPHQKNIDSFINDIKEHFEKFKTAVKYKSYHLRGQLNRIEALNDYCNLFTLPVPDWLDYDLNKEPYLSEITKQDKRLKEIEALREEKRVKLIASFDGQIKELENNWINGNTNQTYLWNKKPYVNIGFTQTRLRAKDDNIETSQGAKVPIREAKILYERIKAGKDIKGFKIGYYTVIGMNGALKVGCHIIERGEIDRLANVLNW